MVSCGRSLHLELLKNVSHHYIAIRMLSEIYFFADATNGNMPSVTVETLHALLVRASQLSSKGAGSCASMQSALMDFTVHPA